MFLVTLPLELFEHSISFLTSDTGRERVWKRLFTLITRLSKHKENDFKGKPLTFFIRQVIRVTVSRRSTVSRMMTVFLLCGPNE